MAIAAAAAADRGPGISRLYPGGAEARGTGSARVGLPRLSPAIPRTHQEPLSVEEPIEIEGTVSTVLPGTMFRVKLDNQQRFSPISPARCASTSCA